MKMLRLLLAAALILAPFEQALAGAGTITTKDASGITRTFVVVTDGTGNFVAPTVICDATAAATCAVVGAAGLKVDGSGATQPVSGTVTANIGTVATLSTAALQTTGNTSLSSIDTKTPALGQAVAGSSSPVVLPSAQITTLTPTSAVNTWASGTLGAMATYGTSPGAVLVPGINAFVTNSNNNGSAVSSLSSPVVIASDQAAVAVKNNGGNYETIAASQTAQVMGPTGATGDYLSHCVIYPASTSPGVVTVFDNTNAAGTNVIAFAGGATSTSNLTPIAVPVGAVSTAGAWKVTTGANVSAICYGKFT